MRSTSHFASSSSTSKSTHVVQLSASYEIDSACVEQTDYNFPIEPVNDLIGIGRSFSTRPGYERPNMAGWWQINLSHAFKLLLTSTAGSAAVAIVDKPITLRRRQVDARPAGTSDAPAATSINVDRSEITEEGCRRFWREQ